MLLNAKNGIVSFDDKTMDYVCFGTGKEVLVMIPGLGDGLRTVKGTALQMAVLYRKLAKDYRVYLFSRINELKEGCSTKDMADDLAEALKRLGIRQCCVVGVSQGGMIAQHLAVYHPDMVNKLILTVTSCRCNELITENINYWIRLAKKGMYGELLADTAEKSYTAGYLKKIRPVYPLLGKIGRQKDYTRFQIQAKSCLTHDASEIIGHIRCPVYVIGASEDKIVGADASKEIKSKIPYSCLHIYEGYGHGVYEEAKDWIPRIMHFLSQK